MKRSSAIDEAYWRDVICRGRATFLVGAGISAPPPACLPLAAGLVESLIRPVLQPLALSPALASAISRALVALRPEVITDVLLEHLGIDAARPLLEVLRGRPNAWHGLLAAALGTGCCVITTNFDTLIEAASNILGVKGETFVGTAMEERYRPRSILFKIHGSIEEGSPTRALSSVALAVRQVGRGLTTGQTTLLRALVEDRPLIVLGYSGRDDFDILPALLSLRRSAPGIWIVHQPKAALRILTGPARRRIDAQSAVACAAMWPGLLDVLAGETTAALEHLRPGDGFGRFHDLHFFPAEPVSLGPKWVPHGDAAAVSLMYALAEARAFRLATRLFKHAGKSRASARLLIAHAVVLEKWGIDLRAAAKVARRARSRSKREPGNVRALALDQSGVIARRRGLHGHAIRFYDQALQLAKSSRCPAWLIVQIRSHRAVALEYLGRRAEALREHRSVAAYERRMGDLRGVAKSLNNIGIVQMNQGRWKQAIAAFEQSCALKRDLGDARGIAQSLHNLGKLHYLRGDYGSAEQAFQESLRIRLGRGHDEHGAAQSYVALAHVAARAGNSQRAAEYATFALEAHARFGDQRGVTQARNLLAALQPS